MLAEDGIFSDDDFLNLLLRRSVVHHVQHHVFKDGAQASSARFLVKGFPCDRPERAICELELHSLKGEQFFILFCERVSRLGQDSNEGAFIQLIQGGDNRQPTDKLRNQAVFEEIFRLNSREQFTKSHLAPSANFGSESHRFPIEALFDNVLEPHERPSADEQDIAGIDLNEFLVRMLAPALRRHVGDGSLDEFEQRLLYPFARHVASDGWTVALAADLVDFIDVDNATLGPFHIVVCRLQKLEDDVFHVLADVSCLREGGGIGQA